MPTRPQLLWTIAWLTGNALIALLTTALTLAWLACEFNDVPLPQ